jgi:hypothetical protein
MSSMSGWTFAIAASISAGDRRKASGDHLSNFSDSSRIAVSPRVSDVGQDAFDRGAHLASLAATFWRRGPA